MAKKVVPIRYTSRDFASIKEDLVNYARKYYPDTFQDFSEASFGSLMLDSVAYVGDIMSYYLDYQANESFLDTAVEYSNIVKLGNQMGYKESGSPVSTGIVSIYFQLPSNANGTAPNFEYLPTIKRGTTFATVDRKSFTLAEDVVVNQETAEIVSARLNPNSPLTWAVKVYGKVISGQEFTEQFTIGNFEKFKEIELGPFDITEIVSVMDSNGNEYYEVENLTQNIVYKSLPNLGTDKEQVPNILKPVSVTRRFAVNRIGRITSIQFGGASAVTVDDLNSKMVDPSDVILNMYGRDYVTDSYFDPTKLLNSDKLGLGPENTTITVIYRRNTKEDSNAAAFSVNEISNLLIDFENEFNLDRSYLFSIRSSFAVENEKPILGATTDFTSAEIKTKIAASLNTQGRAVTENDYRALCYVMPAKYGKIKRAKIIRDVDELKRNLNVYVISENSFSQLTSANDTMKQNLRNWLNKNRMINDTIDIIDAKIVNFGINFSILGDLNIPKYKILASCIDKLNTLFSVKGEIGEPLMITNVYDVLKRVEGVIDVRDVQIISKTGSSAASGNSYSSYTFDFDKNTSPDGRFMTCPKNVILELKFPEFDIKGKVI